LAKWSDIVNGNSGINKAANLLNITKDATGKGLVKIKFIPTADGNEIENIWQHNDGAKFNCLGMKNGCPACNAGSKAKSASYANVYVIADKNNQNFEPCNKVFKMSWKLLKSIQENPEIEGQDLFGIGGPIITLSCTPGTFPAGGKMIKFDELAVIGTAPSTLTPAQYEAAIAGAFDIKAEVAPLNKTAQEIVDIMQNVQFAASTQINTSTDAAAAAPIEGGSDLSSIFFN